VDGVVGWGERVAEAGFLGKRKRSITVIHKEKDFGGLSGREIVFEKGEAPVRRGKRDSTIRPREGVLIFPKRRYLEAGEG